MLHEKNRRLENRSQFTATMEMTIHEGIVNKRIWL